MIQKLHTNYDFRARDLSESLTLIVFCLGCCVGVYGSFHLLHNSRFWGMITLVWSACGAVFLAIFAMSIMPVSYVKERAMQLLEEYVISIEKAFDSAGWVVTSALIGVVGIVALWRWIAEHTTGNYSVLEGCITFVIGLLIFLFAGTFTSAAIIAGKQQLRIRIQRKK